MTTHDRPAIRVLIADDDSLVRTGIRAVLTSAADIEVVAEAEDGRAAVEAGRRHRPDIALLDIRMPVLDGLAALEQFRQLLPATRVVMLTTSVTTATSPAPCDPVRPGSSSKTAPRTS